MNPFFSDIRPFSDFLMVNYIKRDTDFSMRQHSHEFTQLIYVLDGELEINVGGELTRLTCGWMHILPVGIEHSLSSNTGYSQLGIDLRVGSKLTSHAAIDASEIAVPRSFCASELRSHAEKLRSTALRPYHREALYELFVIEAVQLAAEKSLPPMIAELDRILAEDTAFRLTLDDLASRLGYSASHAERCCRDFYGVGIITLKNRRRFSRACALLLETDLGTTEITNLLGFSEASNFCGFFRRFAGVSPSEYRQGYRSYQKV